MSFIIPKPGIDSIKPYKGGNHNISGENMINLASNESSMGPSPNAMRIFFDELYQDEILNVA